jgi:hypothetical protein
MCGSAENAPDVNVRAPYWSMPSARKQRRRIA